MFYTTQIIVCIDDDPFFKNVFSVYLNFFSDSTIFWYTKYENNIGFLESSLKFQ